MAKGAYVFVAIVYLALATVFIGSTGLLVQEFWTSDWKTLLISHSHLFLFFPIFGVLALAAFYLPSVVFTDLYWRHIPFGRVRFLFGMVVAIVIAIVVSARLTGGSPRAVWEVAPKKLDPAACGEAPLGQCRRDPILQTLIDLRENAKTRGSLAAFARSCSPDPLVEPPATDKEVRYCFSAQSRLDATQCCRAQKRFVEVVDQQVTGRAAQSETSQLDLYIMPFKVFFIVVVVLIGAFLALWRRKLNEHYPERIPAIERGVVIGAVAMLFWPLMDYAYQQASDVLFGRDHGVVAFRYSLIIAPWAVLLLLYFMERLGRDLERVAQISTIAASAVAILRYQDINDWSARLLGVGASWYTFAGLGLLAILGLVALIWPYKVPFPTLTPAERVSSGAARR